MTKLPFRLETFAIVLTASWALVSCGSSGPQEDGQGREQQIQAYPVLTVKPRSVVLTTSYPATLEGEQTVEIRPRVQGYITEMRVDEGDRVEKGQVLFRLNSEEYQQAVRSARADVESARAGVQTAEAEVERIAALVEQDIISDYELKAARNTLQQRQAELSQAQAALSNARVDLSYTTIRSPTRGVIGEIPYRIGSLVSSSITQPLTVVSDVSEVYAYFSMSERELLEMSERVGGDEVRGEREIQALRRHIEDLPKAKLILTDGTTYSHRGDIKLASGLINTETGSASFRAVFPNPDGVLRSGAAANIQIPFADENALAIPKSATYEIQTERFVYRVADSNTVVSVKIQVAALSTDKLYVVEQGLSSGDRIVTEGTGSLQDSTRIRPQPLDADSFYRALTAEEQPSRAQADG